MRVTCDRCHVKYELRDHRVPLGGAQARFVASKGELVDFVAQGLRS